MLHIDTVSGHERRSTQELLLLIEAAVEQGETDFYIAASGQHDIGGPLWNRKGAPLTFTVRNPGQRVGAMCLPATTVLVEGPAPADVGWLNAGGRVVVRGDVGDTAGHCAASGVIYVGGRAGARAASLMKHDPMYDEPSLWVLQNVGSFSFEFMGGGRAVVCGLGCEKMLSVLGERPCVGMVGGIVYYRGQVSSLPAEVCVKELETDDIAWLESGLDDFLAAVDKQEACSLLADWSMWHKIVPEIGDEKRPDTVEDITAFRRESWIPGGIFGDVVEDNFQVSGLVACGDLRLREPVWQQEMQCSPQGRGCRDCGQCLKACPERAIARVHDDEGGYGYISDGARCIGCGICTAICPLGVWQMHVHLAEL